jgi:hypothetical protein
MRRPTRHLVVLPAVAVLALVSLTAACSSDDSSSTTTASTTASTTTAKPKDLSVDTPAGKVSLSLDGKLPSGWPSDFPLPAKTTTAGSGSLQDTDSGHMVGVFSTEQSGSDAFDFYTGNTSLAPTDVHSAGLGSAFVGSADIGGAQKGSVTVAGISGTTYIVVVLDTGGTGSSSSTTTTAAAG